MRWLALVLAVAGCAPGAAPPPADATHGADEAAVAQCLGCHTLIAPRWRNPSSHALLLDCGSCHQKLLDREGFGHRGRPSCGSCHSAQSHQGLTCVQCHDPHGSSNAFLVRLELGQLSLPEGASPNGLAHAGTGVCESCHATTRYYRASGGGEPHPTGWCATCHLHELGFRTP